MGNAMHLPFRTMVAPGYEHARPSIRLLDPWLRRLRSQNEPPRQGGLTAVEYEAVSLIAFERHKAYARAREQARYCQGKGSEQGFRFWSAVADEVVLRTKRRMPERR